MFDFKEILRQLRCGYDIQPAVSLLDVPEDIQTLHVTKKTLALERLPHFANLRFLNAHDIRDTHFHHICSASQITHLGANLFGVKELHELRNLVNLRGLNISDNTKATSLSGFDALTKLELLVLENCPISVDLAPLSACKDLRYLWLSSRYAKAMRVNSLSALSDLTKLERINFTNVRVEDCRLTPLHKLNNLVEIELPNFFPREEFVALASALPNARGRWLDKLSGTQPDKSNV